MLLDRYLPPEHLPWKPLDIDAPIGLATGFKIGLISLAPSSVCLDKLASAKQLDYQVITPKKQGVCGWKVATTMLERFQILNLSQKLLLLSAP